MSRKHARAKETVLYPEDVGKAMQLLSKPDTVDPDAVVAAFAEVRQETADQEVALLVAFLRGRPCPVPETWEALLREIEGLAHRAAPDTD